jgi:hypothetical protein
MSRPDHDLPTTSDRGDGAPAAGRSDAALRRIGEALHGLRYGTVLAIVQDGVVVQVERTEKIRFGK